MDHGVTVSKTVTKAPILTQVDATLELDTYRIPVQGDYLIAHSTVSGMLLTSIKWFSGKRA